MIYPTESEASHYYEVDEVQGVTFTFLFVCTMEVCIEPYIRKLGGT